MKMMKLLIFNFNRNYVIVDARLLGGDADELCSDVELDFGESSLFVARTATGFELFTLTAVRLTLFRLLCGGGYS